MATRYYSNNAVETELTAGVTASTTTIFVAATTGFPASFPFTLALDAGGASEELVSVTNAAGLTLTVVRGYDNTSAVAHTAGAVVQHMHSASDFADAREHEAATGGVHGVTGDLVGTDDVQVVTNKDLSSATNTFPASLATDAEVSAAVSAHEADTSTHGVTGAVVGTTDSQALSNKDLSAASNTFPASLATTSSVNTLTTRVTALENGTQRGTTSVAVAAATTRYSVAVTFPSAFASVPTVVCSPAVSFAETAWATPTNVTTTGFTLNYYRTIAAAMDVNWIATL